MKIKTSEATGKALDWGVAEIMRLEPELAFHECYRHGVVVLARPSLNSVKGLKQGFSHTDPAVCMGLIEQCKPDVVYRAEEWGVEFPHNNNRFWSPCLARAVARCVISMKLGEQFEVPDELGVMS